MNNCTEPDFMEYFITRNNMNIRLAKNINSISNENIVNLFWLIEKWVWKVFKLTDYL